MRLYPKILVDFSIIKDLLAEGYTIDVGAPKGPLEHRIRLQNYLHETMAQIHGSDIKIEVLNWNLPHKDPSLKGYPVIRVCMIYDIKDNEEATKFLKEKRWLHAPLA